MTEFWRRLVDYIRNFRTTSEVGRYPRGLRNIGNTCYFNSVIQTLYYTYPLYVELWKAKQGGELPCSFYEFCHDMRNGETDPFAPKNILEQFKKRVQRFNNQGQHDSHECLRHLLDEFRKEERATNGSSEGNNQLTAVDNIFGGHLITVFICKECDKHYHLFEPCLDLSLPVFFEAEKKKAENQEITEIITTTGNQQNESANSQNVSNQNDDSETGNKENIDNKDIVKESDNGCENQTERQTNCEIRDEIDNTDDNDYKDAVKKLTTRLSSPSENSLAGEISKYFLSIFSRLWNATQNFNGPIGLDVCLSHFSREEEIDKEYLCQDCLGKAMKIGKASEDNLKLTSATKQTLIFNPPAILTIHFKRFELLPGGSKKRSDMVKYPEHLDLAPYCSSQCLRNEPPRNNIWYSLYAVVVHSGSLDSGHYVAYVKVKEREENIDKLGKFLQHQYFNHNVTSKELIEMVNEINEQEKTGAKLSEGDKSKWYLVNDDSVHEVSIKSVLEQEAYLLFYERIDDTFTCSEEAFDNASGCSSNNESEDLITPHSGFFSWMQNFGFGGCFKK